MCVLTGKLVTLCSEIINCQALPAKSFLISGAARPSMMNTSTDGLLVVLIGVWAAALLQLPEYLLPQLTTGTAAASLGSRTAAIRAAAASWTLPRLVMCVANVAGELLRRPCHFLVAAHL